MGYLRRAGAAAGAAAVLMVGTAAPASAGPDDVKVSPYRVEAGDSVQLTTSGCPKASDMLATSDAFDEPVDLEPDGDRWIGDADVSWDADPGSYEVEVSCDDEADALQGMFVVVGGWGPDTGGGGLALAQESGTQESGSRTSALAWGIGGVVLAAGLAAGALILRRRTRLRG